jgi:hypothetical protein
MAINWDILKSRYLQANRSAQLASLSLNLTRIQTLAQSGTDELVAQHLVRESQFLIEWTVPSLNLETDLLFATELVDLQRLLSQWKLGWSEVWGNEVERQAIAELAQQWCDRLHDRGELLTG